MSVWFDIEKVVAWERGLNTFTAEGKARAKIDSDNRCVEVETMTEKGADLIVIPFDNVVAIKLERV